jgi:acyl-CoA-binding protein
VGLLLLEVVLLLQAYQPATVGSAGCRTPGTVDLVGRTVLHAQH